MIYVYALLAATDPAPKGLTGLQGSPIALHVRDRVAAAVSHHDAPHIEASVDNLWKNERVVETLMDGRDLLPARFGTTFNDESDLDRVLARHHDTIAAGIERVRGCVELGVRVMSKVGPHEPEPATAAAVGSSDRPGHAYMLARAAEERRRKGAEARVTELSSQLHEPLARIARDSTLRPMLTPELVLSAAYLVPRDRVGQFRARIGELAERNTDVRILCTGPWPAYHFVPPLGAVEAVHG